MSGVKLAKSGKPLWRDSEQLVREQGRLRSLCVALEREGFAIRLRGCRRTLILPYRLAYQLAAQLEAKRIARERSERRRENKTIRRGRLAHGAIR
jgi:hypothetical protein